MNLGIKKMALGTVAALAIAGGALTACNNKTKEATSVEVTQQDIDSYNTAVSNAQKAYINARKQEQRDSLNYVENPTKTNDFAYQNSCYKSELSKLNLALVRDIQTPEYRARERERYEKLIQEMDEVLRNCKSVY